MRANTGQCVPQLALSYLRKHPVCRNGTPHLVVYGEALQRCFDMASQPRDVERLEAPQKAKGEQA